ncbi:MAG: peptidoglycan DD-metalloendopeptidase family protein [Anaerolineales bacterium]|nr:peptidoglycan DD-metalloendopeptidase family protein [Anaerolineales bacterium]
MIRRERLVLGVFALLGPVCATGCQPDQIAELATPTADTAGEATAVPMAPASWETVIATTPGSPAATPLPLEFAELDPEPVTAWRPPPYPAPLALRPEDHFYFARPIPSGAVNWPHPVYRYGSTYFGEESIHTGVDLGAEHGTPVMAAAEGEVVWVGFGVYRGEEDPTDPYGLAVSIRHDFGFGGEALFTVYGHLSEAKVWVGQRVAAGEVIGAVGRTGRSSGDHLHFEVRIAKNRYFESRNPELWMVPPDGWGVLAGRVLDSWGSPLPEVRLEIESLETGAIWDVYTYANATIHPDDVYDENFVISDLPGGAYEIRFDYAGKRHRMQLMLDPGVTNLVTFHGRRGFQGETEPAASTFALSAFSP